MKFGYSVVSIRVTENGRQYTGASFALEYPDGGRNPQTRVWLFP
jgi:hypothetical protein